MCWGYEAVRIPVGYAFILTAELRVSICAISHKRDSDSSPESILEELLK